MRLNKYLSDAGICSRREADRLIEAGRVEVDQVKAVPGMQVEDTCVIKIDGKKIEPLHFTSLKGWNALQIQR